MCPNYWHPCISYIVRPPFANKTAQSSPVTSNCKGAGIGRSGVTVEEIFKLPMLLIFTRGGNNYGGRCICPWSVPLSYVPGQGLYVSLVSAIVDWPMEYQELTLDIWASATQIIGYFLNAKKKQNNRVLCVFDCLRRQSCRPTAWWVGGGGGSASLYDFAFTGYWLVGSMA